MSDVPAGLQYTAEHEWIALDDGVATVGVTAYAADQLGDVVYVALPAVGAAVQAGRAVGEIESTKSVGELFAPVDGDVVEVNQAVIDDPALVNADAYAAWLIRIRVSGSPELLDADAYTALIGE